MSDQDKESLFDGVAFDAPDGPEEGGAYDEIDESLRWTERNDSGNAHRLKVRFGDDLRYIVRRGWHVWDGRRWLPDLDEMIVQERAKETARAIRREANSISLARLAAWIHEGNPGTNSAMEAAEKLRGKIISWSISSGNQSKVNAMLDSARSDLALPMEIVDRHPYYFNVENGTLDLKADVPGMVELRPHTREDYLTMLAPVAYDPAATAPHFTNFINQILPDPEVQAFVQRYFGYLLTGSNDEQCLAFFLGRGANGKSTLMDVIAELMGDYCKGLPVESLLHSDRGSGAAASPDLARLPGARFVRASEPEMGARFSTSILKEVTGGERLTVRELYKDIFEYTPEFKLIIASNNKPEVRGGDDGIWRRINLVPFDVQIPKPQRDPAMKAKLLAERSGILNWMLDGYRMWQDAGSLCVPEVIRRATDDYRDDQDPVAVFIRECIIERPGHRLTARQVYRVYTLWCENNSIKAYSENAFGRATVERGMTRIRSGRSLYDDVDFSPDAPLDEGEN